MPEISAYPGPRHIRHGSNIGQPLTRRDGVLKVTGAARYAADNHPPGMLYAVLAVSSIARGRVTVSRCRGGQSASRRRRGHDPGATSRRWRMDPDAKTQSVHVPARPAAERPGALRQPADRGGDRRDAGGRDRRRRAAGAALRDRAGPRRARCRTKASCRPPSASAIRPRCSTATSRPGSRRHRTASRRPTRRRRNTTTRWSRTRSWRHGTATRCRSTRRARAWRWRRRASPDCSASRRRTSISAARSSAAASAPRA